MGLDREANLSLERIKALGVEVSVSQVDWDAVHLALRIATCDLQAG